MSIKKRFTEFLKREGVLEMYMENWKRTTPVKGGRSFIYTAFDWYFSSGGYKTWVAINSKWLNLLNKPKCSKCHRFMPMKNFSEGGVCDKCMTVELDPSDAPYKCTSCEELIFKGDTFYKGSFIELCESCCKGVGKHELTIA